jgi:hypothetical protein
MPNPPVEICVCGHADYQHERGYKACMAGNGIDRACDCFACDNGCRCWKFAYTGPTEGVAPPDSAKAS